jgi:hypothetical protein
MCRLSYWTFGRFVCSRDYASMSYVYDRRVGTQSAGYPRLGSTNPAVPVLLSMGVNEPLSKVFTCLNEFKDVIPAITCHRLYVDRPARLLIRPIWRAKNLYIQERSGMRSIT